MRDLDKPCLCPHCGNPMDALLGIWVKSGQSSIDTSMIDYEAKEPRAWHCDNCECCDDPIPHDAIVIEVSGGVAECTQSPDDVQVVIIDHDNEGQDIETDVSLANLTRLSSGLVVGVDQPEAKCANCLETTTVYRPLEQCKDLGERLDPDSIVPRGECLECGCFVYDDDDDNVTIS